jgi:hypothetical protein
MTAPPSFQQEGDKSPLTDWTVDNVLTALVILMIVATVLVVAGVLVIHWAGVL